MKAIKRASIALCASLAFHTAIATETSGPQTDLRAAFEAASGAPAPAHSLYTPLSEGIARNTFTNNDVVIFGEIHHSTNFKFLADNPAFFREAAANGVKSIYIELSAAWLPLNEAYFANGISEEDFEKATRENFKNVSWTSGASSEDYAQQYLSLCRAAKHAGLVVRPTDFRMIESEPGTSDSFGIPDIAGHDDMIRSMTFRSLEVYRNRTGQSYPLGEAERRDFRFIYLELVNQLSAEDRTIYEDATRSRRQEWLNHSHSDDELAAYQNMLQARYIVQTHATEKKIIFIGGSRHFVQNNSIGDYAAQNGHRKIIGIELIAENGHLWRSGLESPDVEKQFGTGHQFTYRIRTDTGTVSAP